MCVIVCVCVCVCVCGELGGLHVKTVTWSICHSIAISLGYSDVQRL